MLPVEICGRSVTPALLHDLVGAVAHGVRDLEEVVNSHGMSLAAFRHLLVAPDFQRLMQEEMTRWNAEDNSAERLRVKADIMAEEALPFIYAMITNPNVSPADRNAAFKTVLGLSSHAKEREEARRAEGGTGGGSWSFTVNVVHGDGAKEEKLVIDAGHDGEQKQLESAA